MSKSVPEPAKDYQDQRNAALNPNAWRKQAFSPTEKNPRVWGVYMEIGYPNAAVSLHCLIDGTVSMFFSSGGGFMGMGEHQSVRMKAEEFILAAETNFKKLNKAKNCPLPEVNRVRFYVLTYEGIFTAQDNRNIANDDHELFSLFHGGHEVIAAIRAVQDAKQNA